MIWREKERSRISAVQMDKVRGLLSIRRMDKVLNGRIRQLCGVTNGVDKKNDEGKVFSDGLAMGREWRIVGLLRGSM